MSIIASKEKDGTTNVLCAGKVSRDPELKSGNNGTRVKFSVNYGKSKFMDCEAWSDNDVGAVAACLEKGDCIAVMGTYRTWEYNEKEYAALTADMIFTLAVPPQPPQSDAENAQASSPFNELAEDTDGELPF